MRTVPAVAVMRRIRILMAVVVPAPFPHRKPKVSPGSTVAGQEAEYLPAFHRERQPVERPHPLEVQEAGRIVLRQPRDLDGAHPRGTVEAGWSVTSHPSGLTTSRYGVSEGSSGCPRPSV